MYATTRPACAAAWSTFRRSVLWPEPIPPTSTATRAVSDTRATTASYCSTPLLPGGAADPSNRPGGCGQPLRDRRATAGRSIRGRGVGWALPGRPRRFPLNRCISPSSSAFPGFPRLPEFVRFDQTSGGILHGYQGRFYGRRQGGTPSRRDGCRLTEMRGDGLEAGQVALCLP